MRTTEAIESARGALEICAACRFCDDYCAVFRATDRRRGFSNTDIGYLANLCHNCRNCYYACQYAPPHAFDINLPRGFAQIRSETYQEYAWPRPLAVLKARQGIVSLIMVGLAVAFVLAATLGLQAPEARFAPHLGSGAFYTIIPWRITAWVAGAALGLSLVLLAASVIRFWRDMDDWTPRDRSARALRTALFDVLTLRNLGGGGQGCNDFGETFSQARRLFHHLLFYGLALCFASTVIATLYDHLLGRPAPYPLLSLPVVLGSLGGLGMIVGAGGLAGVKIKGDPSLTARSVLGGDYALIGVMSLMATSGLLLLAFRETAAVSALLAIHLGVVLSFFLLLPYGKFAHGLYRAAALLRSAMERGSRPGE
jgi:citrate/tricarballylate utilization protein